MDYTGITMKNTILIKVSANRYVSPDQVQQVIINGKHSLALIIDGKPVPIALEDGADAHTWISDHFQVAGTYATAA